PPTLITLAKRALANEIALPKGARVLVATSGGPDSMALLDVLAKLRDELDFSIVAHGVDHGLRAEAAAELDVAERHAERIDVVLHLDRPAVPFMQAPSNDRPRFVRTRIRRDVIPLLASLDPNVVEHLCALADDLALHHENDIPSGLPRPTRLALAALAKRGA